MCVECALYWNSYLLTGVGSAKVGDNGWEEIR